MYHHEIWRKHLIISFKGLLVKVRFRTSYSTRQQKPEYILSSICQNVNTHNKQLPKTKRNSPPRELWPRPKVSKRATSLTGVLALLIFANGKYECTNSACVEEQDSCNRRCARDYPHPCFQGYHCRVIASLNNWGYIHDRE